MREAVMAGCAEAFFLGIVALFGVGGMMVLWVAILFVIDLLDLRRWRAGR